MAAFIVGNGSFLAINVCRAEHRLLSMKTEVVNMAVVFSLYCGINAYISFDASVKCLISFTC
jgi:hypothetical protein